MFLLQVFFLNLIDVYLHCSCFALFFTFFIFKDFPFLVDTARIFSFLFLLHWLLHLWRGCQRGIQCRFNKQDLKFIQMIDDTNKDIKYKTRYLQFWMITYQTIYFEYLNNKVYKLIKIFGRSKYQMKEETSIGILKLWYKK